MELAEHRGVHQQLAVTDRERSAAEDVPIESEDGLPPHYFDIYSLAVEMADRISGRRVIANSFFASVNAGLIVLLGSNDLDWYVALAGVVLSLVWWALLKSYRDLNRAKYEVINEMEKRLPARIFSDEWDRLKGDKEAIPPKLNRSKIRRWLAQYRELGAVERLVPWMFSAIYILDMLSRFSWPGCLRMW